MIKANFISVLCLVQSFALAIFLFSWSRNDPSLRIAAFVSVSGLINTLTAVASTLLTGKDLTYIGGKQSSTVTTTSTPETTTETIATKGTESPKDPKE
jgi:hypothetical protein